MIPAPNSYTSKVFLALAVLFARDALCQSPAPEFQEHGQFAIEEIQTFPDSDFSDALVGRFGGGKCDEVIVKDAAGKRFLIGGHGRSWAEVQGLPANFPLHEAFPVIQRNGGPADLFAYDTKLKKWWMAESATHDQFKTIQFSVADAELPKSKLLAFGEGALFTVNYAGQHEFVVLGPGGIVPLALRFQYVIGADNRIGVLDGSADRQPSLETYSAIFQNPGKPNVLARPDKSDMLIWAEVPDAMQAREVVWGDFNGDGRKDVVIPGWIFGSWWVGFGSAGFAIEYPVKGLEKLNAKIDELTVGDIDCDQSSDIIKRKVSAGKVIAALSRFSGTVGFSTGTAGPPKFSRGALTETPPSNGPFVCVGYLPITTNSKWGKIEMCPRGYAFFSATVEPYQEVDSCCKLPLDDILTDENIKVKETCPENAVMTGVYPRHGFRCTGVNLEKYALAAPMPGRHWGFGRNRSKQPSSIEISEIPAGFRYVLGRRGYQEWVYEGCLGSPWGSLLVSVPGPSCVKQRYKELRLRGPAEDPKGGKSVPIFPNCKGDVNAFDPNAVCELASNPTNVD